MHNTDKRNREMPHHSHTRRRWQVTHADCFDAIPKLEADSVDTVISDPPYGISINGLGWDRPSALNPQRSRKTSPGVAFQLFSTRWASECLRVLKPGAYLAAFADPRSAHRLALGLEEAGFELRDVLMWLHSQGIPTTTKRDAGRSPALKPAYEPIVLARKPLAGTLNSNLTTYGTGALNVDACRVTPTSCASEGRSRSRVSATRARGGDGLRMSSCLTARDARGIPVSATAPSICSESATASSIAPRPNGESAKPAASDCPDAPSRPSTLADPRKWSEPRRTSSRISIPRSSRSNSCAGS